MQRLFLLALAEGTSEPIDRGLGLRDWPWTWVRLAFYVQRIKSVYERAAIAYRADPELATPLRWVMFDDEKLKQWWEQWEND